MQKKLYCSPDKKLCGVCAGFADYINIDPTLVRLAVVLIGLVTAVLPALVVYFIVALVIPKAPDNYYQLFNNTSRRLTKGHDKKISGVCSGFAERLDIDPTIVRLLFVFFVLLFGSGFAFYIACAVIMPKCDDFYSQPYNCPPYGAPGQPPYENPNGQPYQQPYTYPNGQPYQQPNQPPFENPDGPYNAPQNGQPFDGQNPNQM